MAVINKVLRRGARAVAVSLREYPTVVGKDAQRFKKRIEQNQQNIKKIGTAKLACLGKV